MPAVYLVHHPDDSVFVRESLLPPLAPLGFDRALTGPPSAIEHTAAVLVVVSAEAARLGGIPGRGRGRTALQDAGHRRSTAACPGARAGAAGPRHGRGDRPRDGAAQHELWRRLARLLPPPASAPDGDLDGAGEPLAWNEQAFTVLLTDAAKRNDFAFGAALVAVFTDHLPRRAASASRPGLSRRPRQRRPRGAARRTAVPADAGVRRGGDRVGYDGLHGPPPVRAGADRAEGLRRRGRRARRAGGGARRAATRRTTRPAGCSGVPTSSGTSTRGRAPTRGR